MSNKPDATDAPERPEAGGNTQQRLDTVADERGHVEAAAVGTGWKSMGEPPNEQEQRDNQTSGEHHEIQEDRYQEISGSR